MGSAPGDPMDIGQLDSMDEFASEKAAYQSGIRSQRMRELTGQGMDPQQAMAQASTSGIMTPYGIGLDDAQVDAVLEDNPGLRALSGISDEHWGDLFQTAGELDSQVGDKVQELLDNYERQAEDQGRLDDLWNGIMGVGEKIGELADTGIETIVQQAAPEEPTHFTNWPDWLNSGIDRMDDLVKRYPFLGSGAHQMTELGQSFLDGILAPPELGEPLPSIWELSGGFALPERGGATFGPAEERWGDPAQAYLRNRELYSVWEDIYNNSGAEAAANDLAGEIGTGNMSRDQIRGLALYLEEKGIDPDQVDVFEELVLSKMPPADPPGGMPAFPSVGFDPRNIMPAGDTLMPITKAVQFGQGLLGAFDFGAEGRDDAMVTPYPGEFVGPPAPTDLGIGDDDIPTAPGDYLIDSFIGATSDFDRDRVEQEALLSEGITLPWAGETEYEGDPLLLHWNFGDPTYAPQPYSKEYVDQVKGESAIPGLIPLDISELLGAQEGKTIDQQFARAYFSQPGSGSSAGQQLYPLRKAQSDVLFALDPEWVGTIYDNPDEPFLKAATEGYAPGQMNKADLTVTSAANLEKSYGTHISNLLSVPGGLDRAQTTPDFFRRVEEFANDAAAYEPLSLSQKIIKMQQGGEKGYNYYMQASNFLDPDDKFARDRLVTMIAMYNLPLGAGTHTLNQSKYSLSALYTNWLAMGNSPEAFLAFGVSRGKSQRSQTARVEQPQGFGATSPWELMASAGQQPLAPSMLPATSASPYAGMGHMVTPPPPASPDPFIVEPLPGYPRAVNVEDSFYGETSVAPGYFINPETFDIEKIPTGWIGTEATGLGPGVGVGPGGDFMEYQPPLRPTSVDDVQARINVAVAAGLDPSKIANRELIGLNVPMSAEDKLLSESIQTPLSPAQVMETVLADQKKKATEQEIYRQLLLHDR